MPRYRFLATDLDGTLFGHDLVVRPRTRAALDAWRAAGGILAIATGRMFRSTVGIARDLAIETPLVCYQGALIRCPVTLADTWHKPLDPATAAEAAEALEAAGFTVQLFHDDGLYVRGLDDRTRAYTALSRTTPTVVGRWEEVLALGAPTKLVAIAERDAVPGQVAAMRARFGDRLYVVQSQPTFLEACSPEVNKGAAVAALAASFGVPMAEVVAVGDGQNDLAMIRAAGLGVAMGDGHPELVAAADHVTADLAGEGLAVLIEELLASPGRG